MSDLYITEPPTSGKVILETNYGNIDIELFTLEAPKTCRSFIQHCLNKYYNECHFFKIFKNFMIQTGDPTNTGTGGESIYSEGLRDEFHSRLKFNHRGVVAMNNKNKPNTNGSQFFITLEKCEEMNKKFTIFGKVTGPTFFNAVNISNLTSDEDGKPIMNNQDEIPKIINTEVVINPFKDLKPTVDIEQLTKNKITQNNEESNNSNKKKKKKLKIKNITDKAFFDISDNEEENEQNKEIKEEKEEKNIIKENIEDKKEKIINIDENQEENSSKSENESESESKSLSSNNNEVQNAKQILENEEAEINNKRKNIDDYKKEINLLRQKIKREKEEIYNEEEFKKKVEKEKINQMNILQKFKYDYINSNDVNKLSNEQRKNKLKNFKNIIGGKEEDKWYKTKLKFQTDSQKAFTLDMINKELEKNG